MGRMHSRGKGISASALPYKRTPPSWLKISAPDVEDNICKFAKKGLTPSQIGVILRDSHGIAQVKSVTGSKILRILKAHGLAPEIPEDLYHLIKKAVAIRKHLERNRKDKDSKFRLILVESRIHRLARYYKKTKKLPPVWKYTLPLPVLSWHREVRACDALLSLSSHILKILDLSCFGMAWILQL
ncbi:small ribosomal subunit protein uS15-like isoform X2 [Nicotiana tabacum]|uniref:Small ribosomal subunit protein uS15-like isoform X2 n=1 Tax=Nicotiana tabacum TaxID=4097 RepID=A0AC58TZZ0_TOBAC